MKTKIVKYFGKEYIVANCAKFMATDYDGSVFWYAEKPNVLNSGFWLQTSNLYGEADLFGYKLDNYWRNSLKEI